MFSSFFRDARKPPPVNRDRSVSPSPFMMQSKGNSAAKSQLSTSGQRHLTPSPIPTSNAPTSNNSTPSAAKGGGASSGTKKGQKRQTAKTKTSKTATSTTSAPPVTTTSVKQESKTSTTHKPKAKKKNSSSNKQTVASTPKIKTEPAAQSITQSSATFLAPPQHTAMSSMPILGMELTRDISPIQSANPTPEPILPPSRKKPKLASAGNSSSSSSDSSDSDSEGEEPVSNAPPTQSQPPPHFLSSRVPTAMSQSSHPQVGSMPVFTASQPAPGPKGHIAQKSHSQLLQHAGAGMPHQPRLAPPKQTLSSASSSDSDSDSSSGSSTSDSSSDSSDEENDKEVVSLLL